METIAHWIETVMIIHSFIHSLMYQQIKMCHQLDPTMRYKRSWYAVVTLYIDLTVLITNELRLISYVCAHVYGCVYASASGNIMSNIYISNMNK